MAKNDNVKIKDIEVAKAVIAHEGVDCFHGKELPSTKQPNQLVSCIGGVFWGKPGETWPLSEDGRPLIPWLQVVCTEMKGLYGAFYQREAVCFYLDNELVEVEELTAEDNRHFVVREYGLGTKLVPLKRPAGLERHPFHQVTWKKSRDYPSIGKYYDLFEDSVFTSLSNDKRFKCANLDGIKIGGWTTPLQTNQRYPGEFELQIDITENYMYSDSGIAYLSRDDGRWYLVFECL